MSEVIDKEVEERLLSMMREKPAKLISYFNLIIGREMVSANAGSMIFTQELSIEDKRYEIKIKAYKKEIKSKK